MDEQEEHIEVIGVGFVPGIPGIFGNQKITRTGQVVLPVAPTVPDVQLPVQPDETVPASSDAGN